jgi:hypothetical protein
MLYSRISTRRINTPWQQIAVHWLAVGVLMPYIDLGTAVWLKGLLVGLALALPFMLMEIPKDPKAIILNPKGILALPPLRPSLPLGNPVPHACEALLIVRIFATIWGRKVSIATLLSY